MHKPPPGHDPSDEQTVWEALERERERACHLCITNHGEWKIFPGINQHNDFSCSQLPEILDVIPLEGRRRLSVGVSHFRLLREPSPLTDINQNSNTKGKEQSLIRASHFRSNMYL